MNRTQAFKKAISRISRLAEANNYEVALKEVELLLEAWPGNPQAHVLRATYIQLQDGPSDTLDEAKQSLQEAVDLDKTSPAAAIELGHYLNAVEDNPKAAAKLYAEAVDQARQLLIEALIAQAKVLLELEKKQEAFKCLVELFHLTGSTSSTKSSKSANAANGIVPVNMRKGAYSSQIENLVHEVFAP